MLYVLQSWTNQDPLGFQHSQRGALNKRACRFTWKWMRGDQDPPGTLRPPTPHRAAAPAGQMDHSAFGSLKTP